MVESLPLDSTLMARQSTAEVRLAQYRIFNRLCVAYMRTKDPALVQAKDLRKELAIPERVFAEALANLPRR